MIRALMIASCAALCACRGGPTAVRYAGPPVGDCAAGRAYQPPPLNAPTQPFIPIADATPAPAAKPYEPPPLAEPSSDEPAAESRPAKAGKSAKKKPKKGKAKAKEATP